MSIIDELKKAQGHLCSWGRVQNNRFDYYTDFIYHTNTYNELVENARTESNIHHLDYDQLLCYAINRWYNNIISHYAEDEFCKYEWVEHDANIKNKYVDFRINGTPFDLKMSVFPKWFDWTIDDAMKNPEKLIARLYGNASKEWRHHDCNKIFIVCYSEDWDHNKMKWNLEKVSAGIKEFMENYSEDKLYSIFGSKVGIIFVR